MANQRYELQASLKRRLRLMVITDRTLAGEDRFLATVEAALAAGATSIQLRDKDAGSGELLALGLELRPLVRRYEALFLVNDRLDVAVSLDADGVHLGAADLPVAEARRLVPRDFIIGSSCDTEADARQAEWEGANYLGVGSVFGTRTKKEVLGEAIGVQRLAQVARAVSIPIVGIGGITANHVGAVAAAGAAGVAVVSAVMGAEDPGAATAALREAWDRESRVQNDQGPRSR